MISNSNQICPNCLRTFRLVSKCPQCKIRMLNIGSKARVPRRNASKQTWKKFIDKFTGPWGGKEIFAILGGNPFKQKGNEQEEEVKQIQIKRFTKGMFERLQKRVSKEIQRVFPFRVVECLSDQEENWINIYVTLDEKEIDTFKKIDQTVIEAMEKNLSTTFKDPTLRFIVGESSAFRETRRLIDQKAW